MLPHDQEIQIELLNLLASAPGGRLHCQDVYSTLAQSFPRLTDDEMTAPYERSLSLWANRVQWARQHLLDQGLLIPYSEDNRSYWTISPEGRAKLATLQAWARAKLDELRGPAGR